MNKENISPEQMMSQLEDESRKIFRESIEAKSQEVIENLQDEAVSNALKIWSLLKLAESRSELDHASFEERELSISQYLQEISTSDERIDYFDVLIYSLAKSFVGNKIIFGNEYNVLEAVLNNEVILPTLNQLEKVDQRGYKNLLIIPPVRFQNIAKYLPEGVEIKADGVYKSADSGDVLNRKRPRRQFYTIATTSLPWNGRSIRAREYKAMPGTRVKGNLSIELEKPENKELNLKGLTIAEFIMINLYEATNLLNENGRQELKDEYPLNDSSTYFLGDSLGANSVVVGRTFGRTPEGGWGINIFEKPISSDGSYPPIVAHFGDYRE